MDQSTAKLQFFWAAFAPLCDPPLPRARCRPCPGRPEAARGSGNVIIVCLSAARPLVVDRRCFRPADRDAGASLCRRRSSGGRLARWPGEPHGWLALLRVRAKVSFAGDRTSLLFVPLVGSGRGCAGGAIDVPLVLSSEYLF